MPTSDATAPVVGDAGALLSAELLRERAEAYAAVAKIDSDLNRTTFVLFRLGGERFAIALDDLDEVACVETGIALANVDPTIIGLANLRGELLPLLDTAAMLGTRCEYRLGSDNRTLVIRDVYGRRSGLPVDRVDAVEHLDTGIFQLRAGAAEHRPIGRAGVAEHDGAALSLLDVSGLRQGHVEHF